MPRQIYKYSNCTVQDSPDQATSDLHQFLAMLEGCTKPLIITAKDNEGLHNQWKMATQFRDEKELRLHPMFIVYIQPSSPLSNPQAAVEKLLYCTEKGIPCMYTPCPLRGRTLHRPPYPAFWCKLWQNAC